MKKIAFFYVCFVALSGYAQTSWRMSLLGRYTNPNMPKVDGDQMWNDLTGWYDSVKHREYIIAGGADSIYFLDITNPSAITLVDVEDGKSRFSINRDFETYSHYVYCVAERSGTLGALQIFDLQYLPDSVHKVYESNVLSVQGHTIFIDAPAKRLYICQNSLPGFGGQSAMDILSLENPEQPAKLASLFIPVVGASPAFSNVHEMYARGDTAYVSVYWSGLYIYDLRKLDSQVVLGTITNYPKAGPNHSSWLNAKGDKLMFTDEALGLDIKIFDISDPSNPRQESLFNSHTGALPHNAYWKGNLAIVSSYEDGVYVYDISNTKAPKVYAWYDTYPHNADGVYSGFHGCWGVWPFLPSGNIIASDISEGIFVLKLDSLIGVEDRTYNEGTFTIFPNPFADILHVEASNLNGTDLKIQMFDMQGKLVLEKEMLLANTALSLQLSETALLKPGCYWLKCSSERHQSISKVIKF